jgi:isopenicillin N synthase-like dioxygenase
MRDACIRVGFFYSQYSRLYTICWSICYYLHNNIHHSIVKNHSIPASIPEEAIAGSLPFFELPIEEKMKYDIHASSNFKGYNALLSENTDPEGRGDLNEGFNFGWEPLEGDVSEMNPWTHTSGAMSGQNVWPEGGEDMKGFRRSMLTY